MMGDRWLAVLEGVFCFFFKIEMEERDGMNAWVFLPRCVCHHYM